MRIIDDNTKMPLMTANIPYGAKLFFDNGDTVKPDDVICEWDPFNAVIVSEISGTLRYRGLIENVTYRVDADDKHQAEDRVIIESRDRTHVPEVDIVDNSGEILATYSLPVGAHLIFNDGDEIKAGDTFVKITRVTGGAGDITGGLPRVTELFEARNPSNPAIVSEVDGEVKLDRKSVV